jgi:hypothetical protein
VDGHRHAGLVERLQELALLLLVLERHGGELQLGHQQLGLLDDALLAGLLVDFEDLFHLDVALAVADVVVEVLLGLGDDQRARPEEVLELRW